MNIYKKNILKVCKSCKLNSYCETKNVNNISNETVVETKKEE